MPCGKPTERRASIDGRQITYDLHRSRRRRKSISLVVDDNRLRVLAPSRTTLSQIDEVVRKKADWIAERLDAPPTPRLRDQLRPGGRLPLLGEQLPVRAGAARFQFHDDPSDRSARHFSVDPHSAQAAEQAERWFRSAARERFSARVACWSERVGAQPARIQIRDQKTRWGSASSNGTLSFNWRLIFAQPEIIDYVVVHEICHLIEPNHSPAYWALVERIMPDAQHWRRRLKAIGDTLTW